MSTPMRTYRTTRRRPRGFTLVETLAAMTLFAIVAAAISSMAATAIRRTSENKHAMAAAFIAQRQMEHVRGLEYDDIQTGTETVALAPGENYSVATDVQADQPIANVKTVTVTVSWTGPEGSKSYAITTYYTDVTA